MNCLICNKEILTSASNEIAVCAECDNKVTQDCIIKDIDIFDLIQLV